MSKKSKIQLEKIEENFLINKNYEFEYLIRSTYALYERAVAEANDPIMLVMWNSDIFSALIVKLLNNQKEITLTLEEILWIKEWIDAMCKIILGIEMADFKNEDTLKYFSIAEQFVGEINKNIPEII